MYNVALFTIKTSCLIFLLLAQFIQSASASNPAISFQAVDLRVELLKGQWLKNIRDEKPEFSWTISSESVAGKQYAYQIQVWPLTSQRPQIIWDSGQKISKKSVANSYQGEPLKANSSYQWRVKVWLKSLQGNIVESVWSQSQTFSMAEQLDEQASQHDLVTSSISPQSIKKIASGRYLIDFGKVAFGYLELELTSNKSGKTRVHFGERGNEKGIKKDLAKKSSVRYYSVPLRVNAKSDVYRVHPPRDDRNTKSGAAIAIPGKFGRIAPFRYVELDAKRLKISDIKAKQIAIHYPFDEHASYFHSSDETLNAIWELSKYSMKATSFAGIYVDGDRERIPYEADAYINQLSHYLVDSEYSLARYSHEYLLENPTWPTEWKQHSIMMAWMDWMYTGDLDSIRRYYQVLKKDKSFIHLANEDGFIETFPSQKASKNRDIVDWPPSERDGFEFKKVNTVVNAFHYLNLTQLAKMADALGIIDDASFYRLQAKKLYSAFNQQLFDEKSGLYIDGLGSSHSSAHANILPLAVGLVPPEKQDAIFTFLKLKKMAVSVYFSQYLLEALYLNNQAEQALALLNSQEKRSWFNMLKVGSTITLEAWDDEFKPNQDWNHAWGAVPGNIVGRFILGVKPLSPGFKEIEIAPQLADLTFAEGKVPTILGPVWVRAEQVVGQLFSLTVDIPNNATAKIVLPQTANKRIQHVTINGVASAIDEATGDLVNKTLAAGKYKLTVYYE